MTLRRAARLAGYATAALSLFLVLTVLFIPDRVILDTLNRALDAQGITLTAKTFGKSFPLGIRGTGWTVSSEGENLLNLEQASIRLRLAPLLATRIVLSIDAKVASGDLRATASPSAGGSLNLELKGLRLSQIPFFATMGEGTKAEGIVNCEAKINGPVGKESGFIKLSAKGVDLKGVKIGAMSLPDSNYDEVQGMLKISSGKATIESFTLEGAGLFARLKGDILPGSTMLNSPLNLTLELMPNQEFLEKQKFIFLLMIKYQDTPGHYQIPIRGVLGKPAME